MSAYLDQCQTYITGMLDVNILTPVYYIASRCYLESRGRVLTYICITTTAFFRIVVESSAISSGNSALDQHLHGRFDNLH